MTKDQALDLALEALELNNDEWKSLADSGDCGYWNAEDQDHYKQTSEAITTIKQARSAQQEHEPENEPHVSLASVREDWGPGPHEVHSLPPAAPAQEPLCAVIVEVFGKDWRLDYMSLPVGKHKLYTQQYVYTTPPAQPAVPDAFGTREGEHPQYIQGWNDCRAEMLRGNT